MLTINNPTPATNEEFGRSVAAFGTNILVGAPGENNGVGVVYLLDGTTGERLLTINNPTPGGGDRFGWSVAAVGNNILVGTLFDDTGAADAGAAYLFDGTTGTLLRTINNPTPAIGDQFGYSVAAVGSNILVGAPNDGTGASAAGSAYLFDGTTGALLRTINNPTPAIGDLFGSSVAAVGSNVLVGTPGDDTGATNAGAAYLFDVAKGAALLRTINNPTPAIADQFGWSVAAVGNNILVGANGDNGFSGSVSLFDGSTGALLRTINNPTPGGGDQFGFSMAAVGNNILVGAINDVGFGSASLFDGSTGALLRTIFNPTPNVNDQFGFSVAAVGNNILVGANADDATGFNAGTVYLFDGTTFDLPSENGSNDVTLRRGGLGLELFDNNTGLVLDTQPFPNQGALVISGSPDEDDTLTIDFTSIGFFPVYFDGGREGTNLLRVIGAGANVTYTPSTATSGVLEVPGRQVSFLNCSEIEVSNLQSLTLITPRGNDFLEINDAEGIDGQPANVITGSSGGIQIPSIEFYDVSNVFIETWRNETRLNGQDQVAVRDPGLIAQGLGSFRVITGLGNDTFVISSENFVLPNGNRQGISFDGGEGIDRLQASSNADLVLNNSLLSHSNGNGGVVFLSRIEAASLFGGDDNNLLDAVAFNGPVNLSGGDGEDTLRSGAKDDQLIGGDGDDSLNGGNGLNYIEGGDGDDTIIGGSAKDILFGGDGDDSMIGGAGNDEMVGGDGNNFLDGGLGNDTLNSSYDEDEEEFSLFGSGNNTLIGGLGNDFLSGGDGDDSLHGGNGNDRLLAGHGDNTLIGESGNDTLEAGGGNDLMNAGSGNNRVIGGAGDDTVISGSGADFVDTGAGDDSIVTGAGNDTIRAGAGADTVDAGAGSDNIQGDDGDDSILGGSGNDSIFGGNGDDFIDCGTGFDFFDGESGTNIVLNGEEQQTY